VWGAAIDEAVNALGRGGVIVLPTDTVYGIGADAFNPDAVGALLAAKGRGRQMPPPVLIGNLGALDGLATEIPDDARALAQKFWPGGLTIILRAQPSLAWDLGETHGTVALRMPDHETALALLSRTGPLAVSSANKHGHPAAFTAREAYVQLGDSVSIYLDVVREGALTLGQLREVAPVLGIGEGLDIEGEGDSEAEGAGTQDVPEAAESSPRSAEGGSLPPDAHAEPDQSAAADDPAAGDSVSK
jgi:tRNA threonylcarbamoyl adenosine modification protein (Sua5/YciO/YrdC/YwlC family)